MQLFRTWAVLDYEASPSSIKPALYFMKESVLVILDTVYIHTYATLQI